MSTLVNLLAGSKDPKAFNYLNGRNPLYCGSYRFIVGGIRFCISRYYISSNTKRMQDSLLVCRINSVDIIDSYYVSAYVSKEDALGSCLSMAIALLGSNDSDDSLLDEKQNLCNNIQRVYAKYGQDAFARMYEASQYDDDDDEDQD